MSGFQLQVDNADSAIIATIVKMKLPNGNSFVEGFGSVQQLEDLETLVAENNRAILADQSIRKYVELMPEMIELKAQ